MDGISAPIGYALPSTCTVLLSSSAILLTLVLLYRVSISMYPHKPAIHPIGTEVGTHQQDQEYSGYEQIPRRSVPSRQDME